MAIDPSWANPVTTRSKIVLEIASELVAASGQRARQAKVVLRESASAGWSLALFGVTLEALGRATSRRLTLTLYLAMGWLVLIAVKPLAAALPGWGVFWLTAGGIAYTAGVAFYVASGVRYAHFVWHLFVMAGSACHVVAVLRYAGANS